MKTGAVVLGLEQRIALILALEVRAERCGQHVADIMKAGGGSEMGDLEYWQREQAIADALVALMSDTTKTTVIVEPKG